MWFKVKLNALEFNNQRVDLVYVTGESKALEMRQAPTLVKDQLKTLVIITTNETIHFRRNCSVVSEKYLEENTYFKCHHKTKQ